MKKNDRIEFKCLPIFALLLLLAACAPEDERPGLWLNGESVETAVGNWQFTNEIEEIQIETQPWYLVAHSTTIWCISFQQELYIGSYGSDSKRWEKNIAARPNARLNIADKLYTVAISPVADAAMTGQLDLAYNQKYDMQAVFGDEVPQWRFYRVEQRL